MPINESISDSRAQAYFQRYLRTAVLTSEEKEALRGFRLCGSKVIHQIGAQPAVFVVNKTNDKRNDASFYGIARCHSSWACPYCTAREMAAKSTRIAAAIEALDKLYNQWAIMITLTMPHTRNMSCKETFTILKNAWRLFVHAGNKGYKRIQEYTRKKDNKTVTYKIGNDIYGKFRANLSITHHVRVYEFTWGKNSWHPHIHSLYWCSKENFDKIADYEAALNERWLACVEHHAKKYWKQQNPEITDDEINKRANGLFRGGNRDKQPGLVISKNSDNTIAKITSAMYISGWSGVEELTRADLKKANDGHYTPHQIIDNAVTAKTAEESNQWLKLYTEYALATKKSRRVEQSNSGLTQIIDDWIRTHPTVNYLKKKDIRKAQKIRVVCWFNENQWWLICNYLTPQIFDIRTQILERARQPDGKTLIEELLLKYGIDIRSNGEHKLTKHIEEKVLAA